MHMNGSLPPIPPAAAAAAAPPPVPPPAPPAAAAAAAPPDSAQPFQTIKLFRTFSFLPGAASKGYPGAPG